MIRNTTEWKEYLNKGALIMFTCFNLAVNLTVWHGISIQKHFLEAHSKYNELPKSLFADKYFCLDEKNRFLINTVLVALLLLPGYGG